MCEHIYYEYVSVYQGLQHLAGMYTHIAEQQWEQQQMQYGCHDHRLGKERRGEDGEGEVGERKNRAGQSRRLRRQRGDTKRTLHTETFHCALLVHSHAC